MPNNKFKVFVTRQDIPKEAITRLQEECDVEIYPQSRPIPRDELLKRIKGKDGVFCLSDQIVDKEFLDAAGPNLKVVSTFSAGFEHFDLNEIKSRGIKAGNTPGVVADSTAELAVSLMLATTRRFFDSHKQILKICVIEQNALMDALKSGRIRAAGLDVMTPEPLPTDHPLLFTPNLTLLPHIGTAELRTRTEMSVMSANNIIAALKNEQMPGEL
ncbi:hypothetical protein Anas_04080 [Armadillidium nasatum]|uniref:Glyoxylate reductase/hydroxypyruvate reductase n=1 Tax=Armadillidium nasatum TaxID=96803 RepID=A0A5N5TJN4_9CRUS|nr:hypothetical protein Anas_04080 [Armadillidium nasatum]